MGVHRLDGSKLRQGQSKRALAKLWTDTKTAKVIHNAKFDLAMTEMQLGKRLDDHTIDCTLMMSHVLQNDHPDHSLDMLCWELAGHPRIDKAIKQMGQKLGGFHKIPEHIMNNYQRADALRGMLLYRFFWPMIKSNPKTLDVYNTEIDLIWTTLRMEQRGIMLHRKATAKLQEDLDEQVQIDRGNLHALAHGEINVNSSPQLRRLLYKNLGFPVLALTKKQKLPSTGKLVLMQLRDTYNNPILDLILRIRSYQKGITTLQSYLDLADANGIIHPNINTCGPITGRESCTNPNLQNVAKEDVLLNPFPVPARRVFRPRPGYVNFHIDYAGIELRLIVHYAQDPIMLECIQNNNDPHNIACEIFYQSKFTNATGKQRVMYRSAGKNTHFAICYGANGFKVGQALGLDRAQGFAALNRYRNTCPNMANFTRIAARRVQREGAVYTVFGRCIKVPGKPYTGANYLIQGTAAEIIKRAQNRVHKIFERDTGGEVKLLLPIHDEIIFEVPRKRLNDMKDVLSTVRNAMLDFPQFDVPLEIDTSITTSNWANKKKWRV